jgi:phosphoribosylamine---glycine ligase
MRILVIDANAASLDWTMRCQRAGHKVKWYVPPKDKGPSDFYSHVGKGIVERVNNPHDWYRWADLIVFTDNTKLIELGHAWRKQGWPVIAPSPVTQKWELDRDLGQKVFKQGGVDVIRGKGFNNYDQAISYVKKEMRRFVSKPDGDADKALSYVSKNAADMVYMLERWKKTNQLNRGFIIQEFKPGIEMAVGGWFGPGGFNEGWCENWEFKKLMNDDLGCATGEQGTVVRYVKNSKLANKVLKPVEEQLARENYVGYVDVNCIITEDGTPWPLEFTMRPGWPLFNIQCPLHQGDPAEWLLDLALGRDCKNFKLNEIAVGVVLSIPDYPYSHITRKEVQGIPVYGFELTEDIHPCEMMMGTAPQERDGKIVDSPCMVTAGDYVLVSSGTGSTVSSAKSKAYRTLKKLEIPNSPMYRTDIGKRLLKQLPELQAMGYATGLSYQ